MKKITLLPFLFAILFFVGCGTAESGDANSNADSSATDVSEVSPSPDADAEELVIEEISEEDFKVFLGDIIPDNYGWKTENDDILLGFYANNNMHIQGPDGEATMWEGTWELNGDQLTMDRTDLGKKITVTAQKAGDKILLDGVVYTRFAPLEGDN